MELMSTHLIVAAVVAVLFIVFMLGRLDKSMENPQKFQRKWQKRNLFYENEHTKRYFQTIYKYRKNGYYGAGEWHHIIPRALGGGNGKKNVVKVPYEAHLELHELLPKMCKQRKHKKSMTTAFTEMSKLKRYQTATTPQEQ